VASHLSVPVPPLFSRTNSDNLTNKKSVVYFPVPSDSSQSSPADDEPKLRRTLKDGSGSRQPAVECQSTDSPGGSAKDDDVFGNSKSTLDSSSGHRLDNDVAQQYMNESLRYQQDVNLHEFSLFAGVDGLAASGRHHRQRHHHDHHHQQQQQQKQQDDRPSRIPRPVAAGSRRNSLTSTFYATFQPSPAPNLTTSTAFPPSSQHPSLSSLTITEQPSQADVVQNTQATSMSQATKNSTAKRPGPEATAAEVASGKPSMSHKRSASTWETHQTLADLWTDFQRPTSFSTS